MRVVRLYCLDFNSKRNAAAQQQLMDTGIRLFDRDKDVYTVQYRTIDKFVTGQSLLPR